LVAQINNPDLHLGFYAKLRLLISDSVFEHHDGIRQVSNMLKGIAIDYDDIRKLSRLQGTQFIFLSQKLRAMASGRLNGLQGSTRI
jgi:hypothetical protein